MSFLWSLFFSPLCYQPNPFHSGKIDRKLEGGITITYICLAHGLPGLDLQYPMWSPTPEWCGPKTKNKSKNKKKVPSYLPGAMMGWSLAGGGHWPFCLWSWSQLLPSSPIPGGARGDITVQGHRDSSSAPCSGAPLLAVLHPYFSYALPSMMLGSCHQDGRVVKESFRHSSISPSFFQVTFMPESQAVGSGSPVT